MPESFFILSKDYLELAKDEIIAIAKTYDRFAKSKSFSNLVIIQSKINWEKIAQRATFVKISGQVLRKMSGLFLGEENFEVLKNAKTFACRIVNLSSKQFDIPGLEGSMGDMISSLSRAKVNLENPNIIIYLIFTNQENFFGFSKPEEIPKRPKKVRKHPHELDWTTIVLLFESFPLRVILLSPSGNIFTSDLTRFALSFFEIFLAKSFEELPAIRLIKQ